MSLLKSIIGMFTPNYNSSMYKFRKGKKKNGKGKRRKANFRGMK